MKVKITSILFVLLVFFAGCSKNETPDNDGANDGPYDWSRHVAFAADYDVTIMPENTSYVSDPVVLGPLLLEESSGLASGINNPGLLWTHEDGGNLLYLLDGTTAEILCTYRITGAVNTDWEDMEIIRDPATGKSYIYIADTGDNNERRNTSVIYRLEEPVYTAADKGKTIATDQSILERYVFRYSDGSKDTESMFVDKDTKDVYLVTKRDSQSRLYIIPTPESTSSSTAYFVGTLGFREASGAAVNSNTTRFIIRNRQHLFYWEKQTGEKIWEIFKRTPQRLPYTGEVQGEAVCFDSDDNYYTSSEKDVSPVYPPVYKYLKK